MACVSRRLGCRVPYMDLLQRSSVSSPADSRRVVSSWLWSSSLPWRLFSPLKSSISSTIMSGSFQDILVRRNGFRLRADRKLRTSTGRSAVDSRHQDPGPRRARQSMDGIRAYTCAIIVGLFVQASVRSSEISVRSISTSPHLPDRCNGCTILGSYDMTDHTIASSRWSVVGGMHAG